MNYLSGRVAGERERTLNPKSYYLIKMDKSKHVTKLLSSTGIIDTSTIASIGIRDSKREASSERGTVKCLNGQISRRLVGLWMLHNVLDAVLAHLEP
jgi:hypothetical protein